MLKKRDQKLEEHPRTCGFDEAPAEQAPKDNSDYNWLDCHDCSRWFHAVCVGIFFRYAYDMAVNNGWRCDDCLESKD